MIEIPPREETPVSADQIRDARFWLRCAMRDQWVKITAYDGDLTERFLEYLNHLGATADLSLRQRRILALRVGKGLGIEEIADILSLSSGTIKNDLRDAYAHVARVVNL